MAWRYVSAISDLGPRVKLRAVIDLIKPRRPAT